MDRYMSNFTFYGYIWRKLHEKSEISCITWYPEKLNRRHGFIEFIFNDNKYIVTYKINDNGNKHITTEVIIKYKNGDIISHEDDIYKLII